MKSSILKKFPIIYFILGIIILIFTALSIINDYNNAKDAQSLLILLLYKFFPFVISFILLKIGIRGILYKK